MRKDEIRIPGIIFQNRKNIPWDSVELYLKKYQGQSFVMEESNDIVKINITSIDEYVSSKYTRNLRGTLSKVKANLVQVLPDVLRVAVNKRYVENNDIKHKNNASRGWYRYDSFFSMPVKSECDREVRWNNYRCTIIVKANDTGLYLYDIINIKKEVSNPR